MDRELVEAAQTGNIELLHNLLSRDPLTLKRAAVLPDVGDTALHIACLAGHSDFVRVLLNHAPECTERVNHDGLSPVHIAAAIGSVEILHEFLKVDPESCLVRGRDRRIPLHYAVIKGHVPAVRELLRADRESIEIETSRGETVLHLAVKSCQFDVLSVLVDHIAENFGNRGTALVNKKDERGNTILHLAACKRQHQVIDLLLRVVGNVDVNSQNKMGQTALDLLLLVPSEAGDVEIEDMIRQGGGCRKADLSRSAINNNTITTNNQRNHQSPTPSLRDYFLELFKYNSQIDTPSKVRHVLLLIATLIATTTFQAGLTPPGKQPEQPQIIAESGLVLHYKVGEITRYYLSLLFLLVNTLGFLTSLHMISILTQGFPLKLELHVSMITFVITYMIVMVSNIPLLVFAWFFALPIAIVVMIRIRIYFKKKRSSSLVENDTRV